MRLGLVAALLLACPVFAGAQVVPPRPVPRDTTPLRTAADSARARADSIKKDTAIVRFAPADTILQMLMQRPGYTTTRYEGQTVTFDPLTKAMAVAAEGARKAAVERNGQIVVTDSTLHYHDQVIDVTTKAENGHFTFAPGNGQAPIVNYAPGTAQYNLDDHSGRINHARVSVDNGTGAKWFVQPEVVKFEQGDSTKGIEQRFYGAHASLTSCSDSIPDFHFEVGEIKRTKTMLVARPAILYIGDVPVMWFPFIFQDIRSGRKSGILTPRLGVSDIVRNSPSYRRDIENLGYYWAINNYMDAQASFDWRSSNGSTVLGDPGFMRFNGDWNYHWRDRFVQGQLATSYTEQRDGTTELAIHWNHMEEFSRDSHLTADVNYVTNTTIQRQNTFNPTAALATIKSSLNYQDLFGPVTLNVGGTRTQYPGRQQVDETFPSITANSSPIGLGEWLLWTPSFSYTGTQTLHIDQQGLFSERFFTDPNGALDSSAVKRSSYTTSASFDTPLQIFGFKLQNHFIYNDQQNIFPQQYIVFPNPEDTTNKQTRVYANTYNTTLDWVPSFELPPLGHNALNLVPSVSFQNVDPSAYWVRSQYTDGDFVAQSKRFVFGLSASPTIYGLLPGFGPFSRFRHSLSPTFGYTYAPAAGVSDAFLAALGRTRPGYLGSLAQNAVNFGLTQNIEGKLKPKADTTTASATGAAAAGGPPPDAQRIKLLSLTFSSLTYDFERAKFTHRASSGLTNDNFTYSASSDLLPGLSLSVGYSLFQGSPLSDTARFSPFRNSTSANFNMSQQQNPFGFILRKLGFGGDEKVGLGTKDSTLATQQAYAHDLATQPVAGTQSRSGIPVAPQVHAWSAQFSLSTARQRPPIGGTVINTDPTLICQQFNNTASASFNPAAYNLCLQQQSTTPTLDAPIANTAAGGPVYLNPPTASINSNIAFPLTDKWSATWQTTYDLERHEFASQNVQLLRDLHDWTAHFGFTQSPNGNFAFSFFISLKADQDVKFNYNRGTYGGVGVP